ncbi:MAG: acetylglutamate kinase [Chloroflexi bacterium]|nr:acetylglutamate kinase [Chloroflexota bacterium]
MKQGICVVKISGHCLDDELLLRQFAATVAASDERLVIVHGGGKEISRLQQQLNIQPRYVDGLRVTDAESLALVEMVLCGAVNKRLVRHLLTAGVDAQGLSGVDRGLVRARQMQHDEVDMAYTGEVESVRAQVIGDLMNLGVTPVIAPVCLGADSNFNLNADPVTSAIAPAIAADKVVFISNVAGVIVDGALMPTVTRAQAQAYIDSGVIAGGMIPKAQAALDLLAAGVTQAVITDLDGWRNNGGTTFVET